MRIKRGHLLVLAVALALGSVALAQVQQSPPVAAFETVAVAEAPPNMDAVHAAPLPSSVAMGLLALTICAASLSSRRVLKRARR